MNHAKKSYSLIYFAITEYETDAIVTSGGDDGDFYDDDPTQGAWI